MQGKIFVGNLPFEVSEQEVRDLFEQFGIVHRVNLIKDNLTGQTRGFGFVEMDNAEEAVDALDESEYDNRNIRIKIANDRGNWD